MLKSRDLEERKAFDTNINEEPISGDKQYLRLNEYPIPFWRIGSKNSLNPRGIPLTVSQEYPPSGSRKGRQRSRLSSSWTCRPSLRIRLSAEASAAATTTSIKSCRTDDKLIGQRSRMRVKCSRSDRQVAAELVSLDLKGRLHSKRFKYSKTETSPYLVPVYSTTSLSTFTRDTNSRLVCHCPLLVENHLTPTSLPLSHPKFHMKNQMQTSFIPRLLPWERRTGEHERDRRKHEKYSPGGCEVHCLHKGSRQATCAAAVSST